MVRPLEYYAPLWKSMEITRPAQVNTATARIMRSLDRYRAVERGSGVPAPFIGVLHMRESNNNFLGVLHNGEHILGTGRKTRLVPKGRGPFSTWEQAANDAMGIKGWHGKAPGYWTVERQLQQGERFNGMGYANKGLPSPYVWAGSQHYRRGKYVADGKYSASHVDQQLGIAPVLRQVMDLQKVQTVPGSRRDGFLAFWQRLIETITVGVTFLWTQISTLGGLLTQTQMFVILAVMALMWVVIRTSRKQTLREYKEGRYVPSGEVSDSDGPDLAVDQATMGVDELDKQRPSSPARDRGDSGADSVQRAPRAARKRGGRPAKASGRRAR